MQVLFLNQEQLHVLHVQLELIPIKVPEVVLNVELEHIQNQVQAHALIVEMDIHL